MEEKKKEQLLEETLEIMENGKKEELAEGELEDVAGGLVHIEIDSSVPEQEMPEFKITRPVIGHW